MNTNPILLLSIINTKLRDQYESLDALCDDLNYNIEEVKNILASINYFYDKNLNQFK